MTGAGRGGAAAASAATLAESGSAEWPSDAASSQQSPATRAMMPIV